MKAQVVIDKEVAEEMIARHRDINQAMKDMVEHKITDTMEKLHSELNKQVYEMAQQQGVSIWDICFNYIPRLEYEQVMEEGHKFSLVVKLVPCPLIRRNFDKGIKDERKDVL
jgi:hypothetical protein